MENDKIKVEENVQPEQPTMDANMYIEKLNSVQSHMVEKSEYERVLEDNKRLLDALTNGIKVENQEEAPKVDIDQIRSELFSTDCDLNNLEFWQKTLALRNQLIIDGKDDPFLPHGQNISPTYEDTQAAERVADVVQQCIDYAKGDSELFTQEFQRRTNDVRVRR